MADWTTDDSVSGCTLGYALRNRWLRHTRHGVPTTWPRVLAIGAATALGTRLDATQIIVDIPYRMFGIAPSLLYESH